MSKPRSDKRNYLPSEMIPVAWEARIIQNNDTFGEWLKIPEEAYNRLKLSPDFCEVRELVVKQD